MYKRYAVVTVTTDGHSHLVKVQLGRHHCLTTFLKAGAEGLVGSINETYPPAYITAQVCEVDVPRDTPKESPNEPSI